MNKIFNIVKRVNNYELDMEVAIKKLEKIEKYSKSKKVKAYARSQRWIYMELINDVMVKINKCDRWFENGLYSVEDVLKILNRLYFDTNRCELIEEMILDKIDEYIRVGKKIRIDVERIGMY